MKTATVAVEIAHALGTAASVVIPVVLFKGAEVMPGSSCAAYWRRRRLLEANQPNC